MNLTTYQHFCTLRDFRRVGEEAPEYSERRAFEIAVLTFLSRSSFAQPSPVAAAVAQGDALTIGVDAKSDPASIYVTVHLHRDGIVRVLYLDRHPQGAESASAIRIELPPADAAPASGRDAALLEFLERVTAKNTKRRPRIVGDDVEYRNEIDAHQIGRDILDERTRLRAMVAQHTGKGSS